MGEPVNVEPLPADRLAEYLEGPEPEWDDAPAAPPNPERAEAMLRRLRRERRRCADVEALVAVQVGQLYAWQAAELAGPQSRIAWLEASLEAYHAGVFARSGQKSIGFPSGRLTSRQGQPRWEWDDDQFLTWAAEHAPELVRQPAPPPPVIDKQAAKQALTRLDGRGKPVAWGVTEAGEQPPGVTVTPADRDYSIKLEDEPEEEA